MSSINKVFLLGNVGKDPEVKTFSNGGKLASFTLATTEHWKDKDGDKKEKTYWHLIVVNGPQVDVVERYVKKGDQVHIEGKVAPRDYEDSEGNKKKVVEIICERITLLGGKKSGEKQEEQRPAPAPPAPSDDPFPF